jgi:hypothetical protein
MEYASGASDDGVVCDIEEERYVFICRKSPPPAGRALSRVARPTYRLPENQPRGSSMSAGAVNVMR